MQFALLGLAEPILRSVAKEGYTVATPVQAQAIPLVLAGRDVLGCAQTGTGKTAAFALPILHRFSTTPPNSVQRRVRALILCPTRELATQIDQSFHAYGSNVDVRTTVIFGGVGQAPQVHALRRGVDVLIATPGRLLDLMDQGYVNLTGIEVFVLDEADRMLDMGFINDIRKVVAKIPAKRQTLLFSATMPQEIRSLADSLLHKPASVQVAAPAATADHIDESVYFVEKRNKPALLAHLVGHLPMTRAIVFTRTKHGADRVVRHLHIRGIRSEAIHGNKSQNARQRALANFKANKIPVLVATDIASRGIDIDDVTHVVNYDLTHEPETYVHRIGRTARAGAAGAAVSFCDSDERDNLRAIERLIRRPIPVCKDQPAYPATDPAAHRSEPRSTHHSDDERPEQPHRRQAAPRPATHSSAAAHNDAPRHRPAFAAPSHGGVSHRRPTHAAQQAHSGSGNRRTEQGPGGNHAGPKRAAHPIAGPSYRKHTGPAHRKGSPMRRKDGVQPRTFSGRP